MRTSTRRGSSPGGRSLLSSAGYAITSPPGSPLGRHYTRATRELPLLPGYHPPSPLLSSPEREPGPPLICPHWPRAPGRPPPPPPRRGREAPAAPAPPPPPRLAPPSQAASPPLWFAGPVPHHSPRRGPPGTPSHAPPPPPRPERQYPRPPRNAPQRSHRRRTPPRRPPP